MKTKLVQCKSCGLWFFVPDWKQGAVACSSCQQKPKRGAR